MLRHKYSEIEYQRQLDSYYGWIALKHATSMTSPKDTWGTLVARYKTMLRSQRPRCRIIGLKSFRQLMSQKGRSTALIQWERLLTEMHASASARVSRHCLHGQ